MSGARQRGQAGARNLPLTVVVPVWNEGERFARFWREASPHLPPGSHVRAIYDREDDDTLPVVARLAAAGAPVEAVRNRSTGFPGALLTGLRSVERGPVLVTMADLSDDLGALPAMLERYAAGADVVVGSRYMPGGRQDGAHPLKALLARWGSGVLHRWAAFPVRDATNAFRLYDAELVARLDPAPAEGFAVLLALLVEAWREGARIVEVPASWRARTEGMSRFRLRWLADYGRLWAAALLYGVRRRGDARRGARGGTA